MNIPAYGLSLTHACQLSCLYPAKVKRQIICRFPFCDVPFFKHTRQDVFFITESSKSISTPATNRDLVYFPPLLQRLSIFESAFSSYTLPYFPSAFSSLYFPSPLLYHLSPRCTASLFAQRWSMNLMVSMCQQQNLSLCSENRGRPIPSTGKLFPR